MNFIGKAIIPCAGRGSRVGSPPDGKEMMLDPMTNEPLINYSLKQAKQLNLQPVCIVNYAKTKLIEHIKTNFPEAIMCMHDPQVWEEWPHSVLASQVHWHPTTNLLMLPDTRFSFKETPEIHNKYTIFFTHKVKDPSKFGIVIDLGSAVWTAEKPVEDDKLLNAWGLIKFTEIDEYIFHTYCIKGQWTEVPKAKTVELESYKDITRNGYIERY